MSRQRIAAPRFGRGLIAVAGLMVTLAAGPAVAQAPGDLAGRGAIVSGACTGPNGDNGVNGLVADTKTF